MKLTELTAAELGEKIKKGETTAVEAMQAVLEEIREKEGEIHAYITIEEEKALEKAAKIQKRMEAGELTHPLAGVPVAIKDNLCTKGMKTTCGSRMLENFVPVYTATAVERLEAVGAVIIGKTNMDEFAMGSTTETSAFGVTKNPLNTDYVPGGSSGGSCAAVAAEECFLALGTDTGGSIRQPSACCGVTGIKPTYGRVSRYGLVAYASSLEQIGPVGKDVKDCALMLEAIAGWDEKDSTSAKREDTDFSSALIEDVKGMKVGILKESSQSRNQEGKEAVLAAAEALRKRGAVVEELELGLTEYAVPAYYVIASAEASSNLERFDGVKYGHRAKEYAGLHDMYKKSRSEGFGKEVKKRIMLGSFVLSSGYYDAYYLKALKTKALIKQAFDKAFETYDIILSPVLPSAVPKLGESLKNPLEMYQGDVYTVSVNLAGLPAMSLPFGKDKKGLPIGVQLIGDAFEEKKIIRAGYTLEQFQKRQGVQENEAV